MSANDTIPQGTDRTGEVQRPAGPPRREILAFVALADAPMPTSVDFEWGSTPAVCLVFDTLAEAEPWEQILGITVLRDHFPSYTNGRWRGWKTWVTVRTDTSGGRPLDETTRSRLAEVAQGGEPR